MRGYNDPSASRAMQMSEKVISRIDAAGTATVVLNRPDVHNAFDPEMVASLTAVLTKLASDRAVRSVVVCGAGKNFCAGADIGHMRESARFSREQNVGSARATARMLHTLCTLDKPTIACVRGAVRGGGVGLVAACDIAIAERGATFRLSEVKLGIIPAMISPYVLSAIGSRMARRYMLSGEEFDATEALRIGLLHQVCEEPALDARVGELLAELRSSGPNALVAIKRMIPEIARAGIAEGTIEMTAQRIADLRATPEAQEGLAAFLEKRRPQWAASRTPGAKSK